MSRIFIPSLFAVIAIASLAACTSVPSTISPGTTQVGPVQSDPTQPVPPTTPIYPPTVIARSTPSGSPTAPPPTPVEREQAVLQQVAISLCTLPAGNPTGSPKLGSQGSTFTLSCIPAAGHSTDVTIDRSANLTTAQKVFSNVTQGHSHFYFHIFPAAQWEEQRTTGSQKDRFFYWQPYRWVIRIHSFDDTPYAIALDPTQVAEAIYQAASQVGLFPR